MKKFITLAIILTALFTLSITAQATVYLNDEVTSLEPVIKDNRSYVPLRSLAELLKIGIDYDNKFVYMFNNYEAMTIKPGSVDVYTYTVENTVWYNNGVKTLNYTAVHNIDGRCYAAIRALEYIGCTVEWDGDIHITYNHPIETVKYTLELDKPKEEVVAAKGARFDTSYYDGPSFNIGDRVKLFAQIKGTVISVVDDESVMVEWSWDRSQVLVTNTEEKFAYTAYGIRNGYASKIKNKFITKE